MHGDPTGNPTGSDHVHADLWADRLSTVCANQIASRDRKLFARVAIADSSLDTVCGFRERNQLMMKQDARWIAAFRDLAENRFEIKLWGVGRGRYLISITNIGRASCRERVCHYVLIQGDAVAL